MPRLNPAPRFDDPDFRWWATAQFEQQASHKGLEAVGLRDQIMMYAWEAGYEGEQLPDWLVELGRLEGVDVAREWSDGRDSAPRDNPKQIRGKVWVHRSALGDLPDADRDRVQKAAGRIPAGFAFDVVRVDPDGSVMFGKTTSWERSNPELLESWLVSRQGSAKHQTFHPPRPRYHRTALMLPQQNPLEAKRRKLDQEARILPGHEADPEVRWSADVARRAVEGDGVLLGHGNFGATFRVDTDRGPRVVKVPVAVDVHGRPWKWDDLRGWFMHEAGVANELESAGSRLVPHTVYVEFPAPARVREDTPIPIFGHDPMLAIVREYGDVVERVTPAQFTELERALDNLERTTGWRIADDLLLLRRPDGSLYIGDVGWWDSPEDVPKDMIYGATNLDHLLPQLASHVLGPEYRDVPSWARVTQTIDRARKMVEGLEKRDSKLFRMMLEDSAVDIAAAVEKRKAMGLGSPPEAAAFIDAARHANPRRRNPAAEQLALFAQAQPLKPAVYFASGTNDIPTIDGLIQAFLTTLGLGVGISLAHASGPTLDWIADEGLYRASGVPLFVDSGAFTEARPDGAEMTPERWEYVLGVYDRLAAALQPGQLYVVAPDKVGDPQETWRRLAAYRGRLRALVERGANVIVPIQHAPGISLAESYQRATAALGFPPPICGLPAMKAAVSAEQAAAFAREVRPAAIHLLGLGIRSRGAQHFLGALRQASPSTRVTMDSVLLAAITPKGRRFAVAKRAVAAELEERRWREIPGVADYTDAIGTPWEWVDASGWTRIARALGLDPAKLAKAVQDDPEGTHEQLGAYGEWYDAALDAEWQTYTSRLRHTIGIQLVTPELLGTERTVPSYEYQERYREMAAPSWRPNPSEGTAIVRGGPSMPARWLHDHGMIKSPVLDYGAGQGEDAAWLRSLGYTVREYDPGFEGVHKRPTGHYATVLATYVANVLPRDQEAGLLRAVRGYLRDPGTAYITVRSDVERAGQTTRGYQRPVKLDLPVAGRPGSAIIYELRRGRRRNPMRRHRRDRLPGGKGDRLQPWDVDPDELRMGIDVEMEHTGNRAIAQEIALDHLAEFPDYYTRLARMEKRAEAHWRGRRNPQAAVGIPPRDDITRADYPAIFGDIDADRIPDADDADPLRPSQTAIEETRIAQTVGSLIDQRRAYVGAKQAIIEGLEQLGGPGAHAYGRVKSPFSILKKLAEQRLGTLDDIAGTTLVAPLDVVLRVARQLRGPAADGTGPGPLGNVLEYDDKYATPKGGYKAIHLLIAQDGTPVEVQLKTARMSKLGAIAHHLYKERTLDPIRFDELTTLADQADRGDVEAADEIDAWLQDPERTEAYLDTSLR